MIKTRSQIHPLLRRRLGNGETTSFWVDNWSPFGNLQDFLGASTSRFGIPSTATVASLYDQDHWLLPPARSENQLAIQVHLTTVTLIDEQDHYEWEVAGKLVLGTALERYILTSKVLFLWYRGRSWSGSLLGSLAIAS